MPTWIAIVHRIISTVSIEVKSIRHIGVDVVCTIGRDKSAPFGIVIPRVEIVEPCFVVVVVAAVKDAVYACDLVVCCVDDLVITPSVVSVFCRNVTVGIIDSYDVTANIFHKRKFATVITAVVHHTNNVAVVIEIYNFLVAPGLTNKSAAVVVFIIPHHAPNVNTPFAKKKEAQRASFGGY